MKIRAVRANNRKRVFEVATSRGRLSFPYAKCDPAPTTQDPPAEVFVDDELGRDGFTYALASGEEGSVHIDTVFEYNEDPGYLRDLMLHRLTVEAGRCLAQSGLSKREVIRRLGTSPAQFYRLIDTANRTKSVDGVLDLLDVLGCEVELTVRDRKTVS
jgi:hypothetical protein